MFALNTRTQQALTSGIWVTRFFGWFYMMVSRFAGPGMTVAVAYLILYAIDSHHGLATSIPKPTTFDDLASLCSGVINVTPELVFPGTVVLCLQALTQRRWDHFFLQMIASVAFAALTIILLNAYNNNGITDAFLAGMLLWRAASALFYTVVAEYCSHHTGEQRSLPAAQVQHFEQRITDLAEQVIQTQQANQDQGRFLAQMQADHASAQQEKQHLMTTLEAANLQLVDLTAKLETMTQHITDLQTADRHAGKMQAVHSARSRPAKRTRQQTNVHNVTSIDQARAKHQA